jgi:hypothetical protein
MTYLNLICPDCDRQKQVEAVAAKHEFRCCRDWVAEVTPAREVRFHRIVVHYDPKPIPTRAFDYAAALEDGEGMAGHGRTKGAAITDLLELLELR